MVDRRPDHSTLMAGVDGDGVALNISGATGEGRMCDDVGRGVLDCKPDRDRDVRHGDRAIVEPLPKRVTSGKSEGNAGDVDDFRATPGGRIESAPEWRSG
jgi:hypothetical protein